MKLKLNTKIFRPRLTLWVSSIATLFLFLSGIEALINNSANNTAIIYFLAALVFGFISALAILTYKDKYLLLDKNRWNNKGAWKNEGFKAKLKVIGDWIID